jgi:hypothetical protein
LELSGILSGKGISMRSIVQGDEIYAPPGITLVVDSNNLDKSVDALAEKIFTKG